MTTERHLSRIIKLIDFKRLICTSVLAVSTLYSTAAIGWCAYVVQGPSLYGSFSFHSYRTARFEVGANVLIAGTLMDDYNIITDLYIQDASGVGVRHYEITPPNDRHYGDPGVIITGQRQPMIYDNEVEWEFEYNLSRFDSELPGYANSTNFTFRIPGGSLTPNYY